MNFSPSSPHSLVFDREYEVNFGRCERKAWTVVHVCTMADDDGRTPRRRTFSPMKSINKGARGLLGQTTLAELVKPKRVLVRGMREAGGPDRDEC